MYTLSPQKKPTGFDFLTDCVLQCFLFMLAFKNNVRSSNYQSFEDFGCLSVLSCDASCANTITFFDGICSVFDYHIVIPTRSFKSHIYKKRAALWLNVSFKF